MNINLTKINHSFSVTNSAGVSVQISIVYDVTNAPEAVVKGWIAADRTIAFQRVLKNLTAEQIKAYNGKIVVFDGSRSRGAQIDPFTAVMLDAKAKGIDPTDTAAMAKFLAEELKKRS